MGANGAAVITPDSPVYQLFQKVGDGKAVFNGGFAEAVVEGGGNLGKNAVLSTVEGTNSIRDLVINSQVKTPQILNQLNIQSVSDVPRFDFPPIIPIVPNRPLEESIGKIFDQKSETPVKINILRKEAEINQEELEEKINKDKDGKKDDKSKELESGKDDAGESEKDNSEKTLEEDPVVTEEGDIETAIEEVNKDDKEKEGGFKSFEIVHLKRISKLGDVIANIKEKTLAHKRSKELEEAVKEKNEEKLILTSLKANYDRLVFGKFKDSKYQEA